MSTVTIQPDLHHHPLARAFPVAPTAIPQAQQVPSAVTAHQAQVLVAALVSVMVSLAEVIASSSTVEVHAVATVTIPAPVVHLETKMNTFLQVLEDTVWL